MSELAEIKQLVGDLNAQNERLLLRNQELEFQLKELTRLIPGSKSEKRTLDTTHPKQLNLFYLPKTEDS